MDRHMDYSYTYDFVLKWLKLQKVFAEEKDRPVVEDHRTYEVRHDSHSCWIVPKYRRETDE